MSNVNQLNTRIQIIGMKASEGPEVGEEIEQVVHECWARIDTVRFRDMEQAKANNTLSDINFTIRDTRRGFIPTNKHSINVLDPMYENRLYNIKSVQPNMTDKRFVTLIAGLVE
ncbi:phage head closure protein [Planomicrobium chinense]|uniref:phage head closure protein n=1 Tax=Planococcus chinensis TaxID=272917 RepID=UPI001CC45F99|nr:phage head closure protein [Planococcus chinensis]MBZ5203201.1 phage head closure protein [Planococcus chinensis]